jgi:SAM-dependent methyltransferase
MTRFEDHFSKQAQDYARHRPQYPPELFAWLASVAPHRNLAWDCGTGNGQAALGLASQFERVVATDASAEQIGHATAHEQIEYRVEPAEAPQFEPGSVGLVTVAIAVHWFDLPAFYAAVRRVAAPGGILAVWTYHLFVAAPEIDRIVTHYYQDVVGPYWPERIAYIADRYRTLPFPFDEIAAPEFEMRATWRLAQVIGFLDSWSASRRYREAQGRHPIEQIEPMLASAWGDPEHEREIRWPLYLRVGRVH